MRIQRQVNRFRLRDIRVDILKALYESLIDTWDEARYLCGVLSSEALRSRVHQYQAQGQFGARHFDKYVFNLPIPRFTEHDSVHRAISEAATTAASVADRISQPAGRRFLTTRKRIREALAEHGISVRLEQLVTNLLNET